MKILIVDDDREQLHLFSLILSKEHTVITTGATAALALDWAKFDLAIVDLMMPGGAMSGDQLIKWVDIKYGDAAPRMILFSALALEQQRRIYHNLPAGVTVAEKISGSSLLHQLVSFTEA